MCCILLWHNETTPKRHFKIASTISPQSSNGLVCGRGALCIYSRICIHSGDEYRKSAAIVIFARAQWHGSQFVCRLIPFSRRHGRRPPLPLSSLSLSSSRAIVFISLVRSAHRRMILFSFCPVNRNGNVQLVSYALLSHMYSHRVHSRQTLPHRATVRRSLPSSV